MRRKYLLIAFGLLLIVATIGFLYWRKINNKVNNFVPFQYENTAYRKPELFGNCDYDDFSCVAKLAFDKNDPDLCVKMGTAGYNDDHCYSALAFLKDEISFCKKVKELSTYQPYCYRAIAVKRKDTNVCDKIISDSEYGAKLYKDGCYVDVYRAIAEDTFDLSYCDKAASYKAISTNFNLGACYGKVAQGNDNLSICKKLSDARDREICYYNFAIYKKDCSLIPQSSSTSKLVETCISVVKYQTQKQ